MGCAPILISTLNRDIHFIRLIESLKRNTWAKYTPVYVALDYPPSEKYAEGHKKICEYLEGDFGEFLEFIVVRRDHNYGSYKNMAVLREMVLKKYDRFIRTDDDAEFSPNFLEYMNKCLDKYEEDESVVAVTGYSYPIIWDVSSNSNVLKINFNASMWGSGFWKKKYEKMKEQIEVGELLDSKFFHYSAFQRMIDVAKYEYVNLCLTKDIHNQYIMSVTDISCRLFLALQNKYVVIPRISKVRNWGFDGSGVVCGKIDFQDGKISASNYKYSSQPIDYTSCFDIIEDRKCNMSYNKKQLNRFDFLPFKSKIRLWMKIMIYSIFGERAYIKLFRKHYDK